MILEVSLQTADDLVQFGAKLGGLLHGGETLELIGDIGGIGTGRHAASLQ